MSKEYVIEEPGDSVKEKIPWSRREKINGYKMLSVMDRPGWYIFLHIWLGKNDREIFTGSPLYLQKGELFSGDQWVSLDGAF